MSANYAKLGDLISYQKGYAFSSSLFQNEGTPVVKVGNLGEMVVKIDDCDKISKDLAVEYQSVLLQEGDIIVTSVGSRPPLFSSMVGRAVRVQKNANGSLLNQNAIRIRAKENRLDQEYLYNVLKNYDYLKHIMTIITGNANQVSISLKDLFSFKFYLPPLEIQRKVAGILSTWNEAIIDQKKLLKLHEQKKDALYQRLFKTEKEWHELEIGSFLTESRISGTNGSTSKKITIKLYGNGVIEKKNGARGSQQTKYFVRKKGQFIYSKLDFLNGAFGIVPEILDGYESTLDMPAFDIEESIINPTFFLQFVSRPVFYKNFVGYGNGGRKAKRINPKDLLKFRISLPKKEIQDYVAEIISNHLNTIDACKQKIMLLEKQKKGLMQKLLTGKVKTT